MPKGYSKITGLPLALHRKWSDLSRQKARQAAFKRIRKVLPDNVECLICHKTKRIVPSQAHLFKTCDKKCFRKWCSLKFSGNNNPSKQLKVKRQRRLAALQQWSNPISRQKKIEGDKRGAIKRVLNGDNFSYGTFGTFYSVKNKKTLRYRSTYERTAMQIFEQQACVIRYEYEVLSIPWVDKQGGTHHTIPDFLVFYKDNAKQIIEVKPSFKIEHDLDNTRAKIQAGKKFAKNNNMTYSIWTEKELEL